MPYLGKDWRSNGEKWIRTEQGWERCKALEIILNDLNISYKTESVRKNDSREKKKLKNDTLYYLFDELGSLDSEFDEESNTDEINCENKDDCAEQIKKKQPYIFTNEKKSPDSKNTAPRPSVSEVLNGLDMPGAVRDRKRFNYVCQLVKIIIDEKLNMLSGNGQRTLFMIIKVMIIHVLRTQENVNIVRKLLASLKKKIQESIFFYFHYIGSQKLCENHLNKLSKWQEILDANKRGSNRHRHQNNNNRENLQTCLSYFDKISNDCKLEILRRLNSGLDLVNLSMCNKSLNQVISNEILVWKNLCQFHFNQSQINQHVRQIKSHKKKQNKLQQESDQQQELIFSLEKEDEKDNKSFLREQQTKEQMDKALDWKMIYFRLTKRFGQKEVYADMINKCMSCECFFWKEVGHPCRNDFDTSSRSSQENFPFDTRCEPITPRKLVDLLFK